MRSIEVSIRSLRTSAEVNSGRRYSSLTTRRSAVLIRSLVAVSVWIFFNNCFTGHSFFPSLAQPMIVGKFSLMLAPAVAIGAICFGLRVRTLKYRLASALNSVFVSVRNREFLHPASDEQVYIIGIAWYLLHFVIGVCNDAMMRCLMGSLHPFQVVFLRHVAAAGVLLPAMSVQCKSTALTQRYWLHFARGSLLACGTILWCISLSLMPFATCIIMNNIEPLFTLLFAKIVLREKVRRERWLASIGGLIGCVVVFYPTAETFQAKSCIMLLSSLCFSAVDILNKKYSKSESTVVMNFYGALATTCWTAVGAFRYWAPLGIKEVLCFILLGIGSNVMHFCVLHSFKYVDASATCPYSYAEFVFAAIAGFLAFSEMPTNATIFGSIIILASLIYCAKLETAFQRKNEDGNISKHSPLDMLAAA